MNIQHVNINQDAFCDKEIMMNLNNMESYLTEKIKGKTTLPELVDAFEAMCRAYLWTPDDENDLLLFETGNYHFSGTPSFQFSLTRQIPNGEGEYLQLHLIAHYPTRPMGILLTRTMWSDESGDFFEKVRASKAYKTLKNLPTVSVECYTDET